MYCFLLGLAFFPRSIRRIIDIFFFTVCPFYYKAFAVSGKIGIMKPV